MVQMCTKEDEPRRSGGSNWREGGSETKRRYRVRWEESLEFCKDELNQLNGDR